MSKCKARRHGDQLICYDCRLNWDHDDRDPPKCQQTDRSVVPQPIKQAFFAELRNNLIAGDHAIEMDDRR